MRLLIATAAITAILISPAFASGTGIGKGSSTPGTTTTPTNPCGQGDTWDAAKGVCTRPDGTTYKPVPN